MSHIHWSPADAPTQSAADVWVGATMFLGGMILGYILPRVLPYLL